VSAEFSIRKYRPGEEVELWRLFFETIRTVNRQDYSDEQVRAWAPDAYDAERWQQRIAGIDPYVCQVGDTIVGYADLQPSGLVDHFYVHREWQRRGVGSRLFSTLENQALDQGLNEMFAHVSITAKPFFESRGFEIVKQQTVDIDGVKMSNWLMRRALQSDANGRT